MPKIGEFTETRFHEVDHESKMRLLKTHSHTSGQQGSEAEKERQETRKERGSASKAKGKKSTKTTAMPPARGGGGGARRLRQKTRTP